MIERIAREAEHARAGRPARILARMNSLIEPRVIRALYDASQAGVKIDLIVRGICCLRPGIKGVSENIAVRSVMGRFLEHSRIFYFENGGEKDGEPELYLSSADWMPRNFFRRVEVAVPVLEPELRERVLREALLGYVADNTQAWVLKADGSYRRLTPGNQKPRSVQAQLLTDIAGGDDPG
jgi:polyphosphate kinase